MFSGKKFLLPQVSRAAGFTLAEVLVAMSIFAVSVLGLAVGATTVMRANRTSYLSAIATNLAQDRLEELKARTTANITSGGPDTTTVDGVAFTRTWTVAAGSPISGVNQIAVEVRWTDYTSQILTISSAVKP